MRRLLDYQFLKSFNISSFLFIVHAIKVCFCRIPTFDPVKPPYHHTTTPQTPFHTSFIPSCKGVRCVSHCDGSGAGLPTVPRDDEACKSEGWSLSLPEPWQDPWAQIESRRIWSSFSELLLFNCDLQECVRYGNLSRNSRFGLSKSTLWNRPLHPVGRTNL